MFAFVLEFMLTLTKMENTNSFIAINVLNLRLEHFESYSSFSYCTHSFVYRVFWSSGRVVNCKKLILFRLSTTGPEHQIYITMRTVWKA